MRLKTLEIVGFKSFASPFRIDFNRGIASIVGPNGCGKSNIADAIRWVLGAQSPKQLRAERMDSVIFSGSTKRKQLGMAEVTLVFDNSDRSLNLDYDEVSVSRRLFRSGDSEYSINGSKCRLMDITDLVADRGLGSTGYWVLESKMVGTILSSRPEDRRFLFDEAAGIVKYKIQRHRAELKLDSTGSDLERLADIISEVETNCMGLKRQVSAFTRHKRISEDIRSLKEASDLIESFDIRKQLESFSIKLDETGAAVGKETASLAARSAVLAEARTEFSRVQGKLDDAHLVCSELDSLLASNDRETAVTEEKIASAESRMAENNARMARERERVELYSRDILKLQEESAALVPEIESLEKTCLRISSDEKRIRESIDGTGTLLREIRTRRATCEQRIEEIQRKYMEEVRAEEARAQRVSWLNRSVESLQSRKLEITADMTRLSAERDDLNDRLQTLTDRAAELREELSVSDSRVRDLEAEVATHSEQIAVMKENLRRARGVLAERSFEGSASSLIVPLDGMGKALGAFLYGFDCSVPADLTEFAGKKPGSLCLTLPADFPLVLPEGAVLLSECVESCGDPMVLAVLGKGVLAPDRDTAIDWIRGGLPVPVVTGDGDLFRPEGFLRLGVETDTAGSLELTQIIDEFTGKLEEMESRRGRILQDILSERGSSDSLKVSLESALQTINSTGRLLAGNESTMTGLQVTEGSLEGEICDLQRELEEIRQNPLTGSEQSFSEQLVLLKNDRDDAASREAEIAGDLAGEEALLAETLRLLDSNGFQLREKQNRKDEILDRISMLQREAERIHELLEELSRSNREAGSSVVSMREQLADLKSNRAVQIVRRGEAESVRNGYSVERNRLMETSAVLEKEVQQIRDRLGRSRSAMIELESGARSLREKLERIEVSCTAEENPFLGLSPVELRNKLMEENQKLEKIGPVNMLAMQEYEETSGRLDYLTGQKTDLEQARASLSRAISEINAEAEQRFQETFDKVRANFQEMFVKLFGGGEGDIISIEGEDPLEGGIEIMARPRGKTLKNVIALSEGEKALTAVALLFSLYLVKPSPFCVLDELDGPFDDSNTDKFVAILREFSDKTQFIVITHNKRTMEGSDVLYGITMAEEGVSTITSVNLEEMVNEPKRKT